MTRPRLYTDAQRIERKRIADAKYYRTQRESFARKREAFAAYKRSLGCSTCGYNTYGGALEYHHDDGRADNTVRDITFQTYLTPKGEREIAECTLLCSNCHREWHGLHGKKGHL